MPRSIVQSLRRWDPEQIGPYTIIGRLGAGAMGQVFLARSTAGRLVAVKTIRVELAEEPGFRARFAREVAAARRVSGVFTAAVIEADPDADLPWVATAYVPAPSLSTLVTRAGPLPVPAVRWLAAGCAEALASIHGAGLLHRDVKPSNVLVAPDGPRVIDFGVARASERVQLTSTRGAAGTPAYMAPEQARDATRASPASDVFSLGATLVYAATGHPPYHGETVMDILVRLATEPPDLDGVPDELTALVTACLARVPRDRPTDAAILSGLGPFALSAGAGHVYLPDAAMAVIAEYPVVAEFQHRPRPAAEFAGDGEDPSDQDSAGSATDDSRASSVMTDVTDGSQTPLPGFESLAAFPQPPAGRAELEPPAGKAPPGSPDPPGAGEGDPLDRPPPSGEPGVPAGQAVPAGQKPARGPGMPPVRGREPSRIRRRRGLGIAAAWLTERALLPFWARLLIAVLLVAAGTAIGLAVRLADPATAGAPTASTPTASASTAGISATGTSTTSASTVSSSAADNAAAGNPASDPAGLPPALCNTQATSAGTTTPELCVSQPYGDGYTVFVVHGSGFQPFGQITVEVAGAGVSPDHPVADKQGTFNYAIDQGHLFFAGPMPAGNYRVIATEAGGLSATVTFQVNQAAGGGPP
jgi:serine/threonine protein kinase